MSEGPRTILSITVAPASAGQVGIAIHVADSADLSLAMLAILRAVAGGRSGLPDEVQDAALVMLRTILPGEDPFAVPLYQPPRGRTS